MPRCKLRQGEAQTIILRTAGQRIFLSALFIQLCVDNISTYLQYE